MSKLINLVNIETVSLLTSKSMTSLGGRSHGSKVLTADSFKKSRTSWQIFRVSYKGVHKAASKLYHEQLSVDGGMLLCKVEKNGIQG
jgi:hypothetical protein